MNEDGKLSITEAMELVTIGEVGLIERHFGTGMENLTGTQMTSGAIWAMERRKPAEPGAPRFDWTAVENMTMKQANDYFAPEPVEADEADPDSDSGKDVSPVA